MKASSHTNCGSRTCFQESWYRDEQQAQWEITARSQQEKRDESYGSSPKGTRMTTVRVFLCRSTGICVHKMQEEGLERQNHDPDYNTYYNVSWSSIFEDETSIYSFLYTLWIFKVGTNKMYQTNKRDRGNARLVTAGQGLERGEIRKKIFICLSTSYTPVKVLSTNEAAKYLFTSLAEA